MLISFDFDYTLSRADIYSFAKELIEAGHDIWIVTSRATEFNRECMYGIKIDNSDLFQTAGNLGIPRSKIVFTNGDYKSEFFKYRDDFLMHFEDDEYEIIHLADLPINIVDVTKNDWEVKARHLIASGQQEVKDKEE